MYLTYDDYTAMGGTAKEPDFIRLEMQARGRIDYLTEKKLVYDETYPDSLKMAMFEMIGLFENRDAYENTEGGVIASESNDGVSVSYDTQSASDFLSNFDNAAYNIAKVYLMHETNQAGVPLLYRGW